MKKFLLIIFTVIIAFSFSACKKEKTEIPEEIKNEVYAYVSENFKNTSISDFEIKYKINEITEYSDYSTVNCSLIIDIGNLQESDCNKELYILLSSMNGNIFWSASNFKSNLYNNEAKLLDKSGDYEYTFYNNSLVSGDKEYTTQSVLVSEANAEYVYKYSILCDGKEVWSIEETIPYVAQ